MFFRRILPVLSSFWSVTGEPASLSSETTSFPSVKNIQLIQAECLAFGTLSITETRAFNRAICFPQKAVQMLSPGSLDCTKASYELAKSSGAGY